jgi:eukaryotic-like serine/threonine-protein kinase
MSKPAEVEIQQVPEGENSVTAGGLGKSPNRRRVGKYRIVSELGRGGMANVYLALARSAGGVSKLVVLKALRQEIAEEAGSLRMFLDEARLAAQLNHPNVVQTYEVGTEGDRHVIVMEHLEGQPLSRILRLAQGVDRQLSESMFLYILIGMLEGLHYAHELKSYEGEPLRLVHRDVSPQNIFVTYDGQVKVLDFGIAKAATSSSQTTTGVIKGKIAYMAPEQMSGGIIDARADVFSVGCIMWAGVTGQKLWKDLTDIQIVKKVLGGEIPNPRTVNPDCSDELARITMKALAIDPDQRYPTARALQLELEKYVEQSGLHIKRREVGEFISKLFGDIRAELSVHIESQLSELANSDTITPSGYELIQQELRRVSMAPRAEFTGTGTQTSVGQSGMPMALVAIALLLAVGVGVLGFMVFSKNSNQAAPATVTTVVTPAPAPTAPAVVKASLRLNIQPSDATIELDGRPQPVGLAALSLEVRKEPYKLKLSAPGYVSQERDLTVEGDMELSIALESTAAPAATVAEPETPAAGGGGARWRAPRRGPDVAVPGPAPQPGPAPEPAAPKGPDCTNLFYYDSAGIKKVRPECL